MKSSPEQPQEYSVVFLGDQLPPTQILMLKRSSTKQFAPNLYTGIGGHREQNEMIEETMRRELKEETRIENVKLTEFARLIIRQHNERVIYYTFGLYNPALPLPNCNEGTLAWVKIGQLLALPIIPTTRAIVEEWSARNFMTDKPYTIYQKEIKGGPVPEVKPDSPGLREGLQQFTAEPEKEIDETSPY